MTTRRGLLGLLSLCVVVMVGAALPVRAQREPDPPSQEEQQKQRSEADEIIAAAKRARENARQLVAAINAGNSAAAQKLIGQEINIGGHPTERTRQQWTMTSGGITVIATSIDEPELHDPDEAIEDNAVTMWGTLKSVDVNRKTIVLANVELIYAPKMD